jgi:tetratricopeptide (TPR) repeat protein
MTPLNSILCLADAHFAREDWTSARDSLRAALEIAPAHPQLLATLGNLHFLLKEFSDACAAFSAAARQRPDDADLLLRLAMTQRELKQFAQAEATLTRLLEANPDDLSALLLLADCYREGQRPHDAAVIYQVLLDRDFERLTVLLSMAKLLFGVGDWAGAQAALEEALQVDPENAIALENLEVVSAEIGGASISRLRGICYPAAHAIPRRHHNQARNGTRHPPMNPRRTHRRPVRANGRAFQRRWLEGD